MYKEQIVYDRGSLFIMNPLAPSVSRITLKVDKKTSRQVLKNIKSFLIKGEGTIRSIQKLDGRSDECSVNTLKERGFTSIGVYNEQEVYVGKLIEDGVDIVIIHLVKDGRSIRQAYLSPKIHMRSSNAEYLGEVLTTL